MDVIDLSIDFDFFVREDPMWDFGHSEHLPHQMVWPIRYRTTNLYKETDIETFADFQPGQTLNALRDKKLRLTPTEEGEENRGQKVASKRQIGVADSHRHALNFFERFQPPDRLVSLDAHHDLFNEEKPDCSNWLTHLMDRWNDTATTVVYPGWKDMDLDGEPIRNAQRMRWENWVPRESRIRHIFLGRSAAWVPPHHDKQFLKLVAHLSGWGQLQELEPLVDRREITPTQKEAQDMYRKFQQQHADRQRQGRQQ